jgi:ATP-dependent DNA helicase RecG
MFAGRPEWIAPQFVVKAIRYPGNKIHGTDYLDTEDFDGPLRRVFDDSHAFIMRNLHKVQAGQGVNAPGTPEVPPTVFEELLVNALIHRDYLISASIRIFIFDNRIEIISPGHLPNSLTVAKIKEGNANLRNPILVSYVAKGLLPYHGLGSGIKRALEHWPHIEFIDDHDGCLFTVIVHRKITDPRLLAPSSPDKEFLSPEMSPIMSPKEAVSTDMSPIAPSDINAAIMTLIQRDSAVTTEIIAKSLNISKRTVLRRLEELKKHGSIHRIGPAKGGKWEVVE